MKASRNTMQRNLVLQTVRMLHHHPTAEEIYREAVQKYPNISKGTVYRNLNFLADRGDIVKVEVPGGADRFDFNLAKHYHVRCRRCGNVYDIEIPSLDSIMDMVHETHGVQLERIHIMFTGICQNCREEHRPQKKSS